MIALEDDVVDADENAASGPGRMGVFMPFGHEDGSSI